MSSEASVCVCVCVCDKHHMQLNLLPATRQTGSLSKIFRTVTMTTKSIL